MHRLSPHAGLACAAVSLTLLVMTIVLWVRSYGRCDYANRVAGSRYHIAMTGGEREGCCRFRREGVTAAL